MGPAWFSLIGASAGGASWEELRLLVAVALLMGLALFVTSRRTLRVRQNRVMVALISGGWLALAVGVMLGPHVLGVIGAERLRDSLTPMMEAALGWVGLMLGLQARRGVLQELPAWIWRLVFADVMVVAVVFGGAAIIGVGLWYAEWIPGWLWWGASVLACGAGGWAVETRSLVSKDDAARHQEAQLAVRAGGTLGALVAAIAIGLLLAMTSRDEQGDMMLELSVGPLKLAACGAGAVLIALVGRFALSLAGSSPDQRLVIFLGMVALSAGFAAQMDVPSLAVSALTGMVLTNVSEKGVRQFERFILRADLVIATLISLLAGVFLSPEIGVGGVVLAVVLSVLRLVIKPLTLTRTVRAASGSGALTLATARQSPVALALALSALLLEPAPMMEAVLGVVVLTGLVSAVVPVLIARRSRASLDGSEARTA